MQTGIYFYWQFFSPDILLSPRSNIDNFIKYCAIFSAEWVAYAHQESTNEINLSTYEQSGNKAAATWQNFRSRCFLKLSTNRGG